MNYNSRFPITLEEQRELSKQYGISFEDFNQFRMQYKEENGRPYHYYKPSTKLQDWKATYNYRLGKTTNPPERPGFNHHVSNFVKTDKCITQQRINAKRHYMIKHNEVIDRKVREINEQINNLKEQLSKYDCNYKLCEHCGSVFNPSLNQNLQTDDVPELPLNQTDSCPSVQMTST